MKLSEIVAEWYYFKNATSCCGEFAKQDSSTRDIYFRMAYKEIPQLLAGYLGCNDILDRVVRGSVRSFIVAHGNKLTLTNYSSLTKRITANIRAMVLNGQNNNK